MSEFHIKIDDIETIDDARRYIISRFTDALGGDEEFSGSVISNSMKKLGINGYKGINKDNIEKFYNDILEVYGTFHPEDVSTLKREYRKAVSKSCGLS